MHIGKNRLVDCTEDTHRENARQVLAMHGELLPKKHHPDHGNNDKHYEVK